MNNVEYMNSIQLESGFQESIWHLHGHEQKREALNYKKIHLA